MGNELRNIPRKALLILSVLVWAALAVPAQAGVRRAIAAGDVFRSRGEYAAAVEKYSEVLGLYKGGEAEKESAKALEYGGNACVCLNRYIEALDFYTYAIDAADRYGDRKVRANCMNNIGLVYAVFSDYERASMYFRKACDSALDDGDSYLLGIATTNLVKAYCHTGHVDEAVRCLKLQMGRPLEDKDLQRYCLLYNQGMIAAARQDLKAALYYFEKAGDTARRHRLGMSLTTAVDSELGRVYALAGQADSAAFHYGLVAERGHNPEKELMACKELFRICRERGDTVNANRYLAAYQSLSDSIFDRQLFNCADNRLLSYESSIVERTMRMLRKRVVSLLWGMAFAATVLFIVLYFNHKLRKTQKLLVAKNEELIRQSLERRELKARYLEMAERGEAGALGAQLPEADATAKGTLGDERVKAIAFRIKEVLESSDIIFNPDFDLDMLADMMDSNTKYVSMAINGFYGKPFRTMLNESRIREACRRLMDKENYGHLTIAAVSQTVGYRSVNNFINAFKRINGMTPSQYIRLASAPSSGV